MNTYTFSIAQDSAAYIKIVIAAENLNKAIEASVKHFGDLPILEITKNN
jgi:diacylglycerol kinase